jgi:hypothetical protein
LKKFQFCENIDLSMEFGDKSPFPVLLASFSFSQLFSTFSNILRFMTLTAQRRRIPRCFPEIGNFPPSPLANLVGFRKGKRSEIEEPPSGVFLFPPIAPKGGIVERLVMWLSYALTVTQPTD